MFHEIISFLFSNTTFYSRGCASHQDRLIEAYYLTWLDLIVARGLLSFPSRVVTDLPDAPVDVQVEVGPQRGTLLVTWMPALRHKQAAAPAATATPVKSSDVVDRIAITGYVVYVDGTKVKELNSPSGENKWIFMQIKSSKAVFRPRRHCRWACERGRWGSSDTKLVLRNKDYAEYAFGVSA